jgi:hypothetical protein
MKMQFSVARRQHGWFRDELVNNAYKFDFPIHKPFYELSDTQKELYLDRKQLLSRIK